MTRTLETANIGPVVKHARPWPKKTLSREVMTSVGIWSSIGFGIACASVLMILLNIAAVTLIGAVLMISDVMGFHIPSDLLSGLDMHMIMRGESIVWALMVAAFTVSYTGDAHQEIDHKVIRSIRDRVLSHGSTMLQHGSEEHAHLKSALSDGNLLDSGVGRPLLFRLDAALVGLQGTLEALGTSRKARNEASQIAREAFIRILAEEDASHDATAPLAIERMRAGLEAIAPTTPVDATAPSARIVHIVAMGEKALAIDPDLVDDAGMPIASLVREHIPRFLRTHALARRTARPERVNEVDDNLDQAVETVRLSVKQALLRLGDDAADALAVELDFLRLRQRVEAAPVEPEELPTARNAIRALPDLTPANYVADFVDNGERSTARLEP